MEEVFSVLNIHCSSCLDIIVSLLTELGITKSDIEPSLSEKQIKIRHFPQTLSRKAVIKQLHHGGFEVAGSNTTSHHHNSPSVWSRIARWRRARLHKENCRACSEAGSTEKQRLSASTSELTAVAEDSQNDFRVTFAIGGMSCASCSNAVTEAIKNVPGVIHAGVDLIGKSAVAIVTERSLASSILEAIQDAGFDAEVVDVEPVTRQNLYKVIVPIGGMTCASCVNTLTDIFKHANFVQSAEISLLLHTGTFIISDKSKLDDIRDLIESAGYDCGQQMDVVEEIDYDRAKVMRSVRLKVDGMFCENCPKRINELFESYSPPFQVMSKPLTLENPIVEIKYQPHAPDFTIRTIIGDIEALSTSFHANIVYPMSLEERAHKQAIRERNRLALRLILSIVVAIPTFIIGIVFMSLLSSTHPLRMYIEEPMWSGRASRVSWALFILATPVYFFAADVFHRKAIKELISLWRPGHNVSWKRRIFKFGSMNLLMSLGTTVAYVASLAMLGLAASTKPPLHSSGHMQVGFTTTYFDSVVFLTMFLLIGRLLEAYSKSKTTSAINLLGNLRPKVALLVEKDSKTKEIPVDMLDVGDSVRVVSGMSPPIDSLVTEGDSEFDEQALTGESMAVKRRRGDMIYSGTINVGSGAVIARVEAVEGQSMLDQIVTAVRQGSIHRAPIERIADVLTGYFVPVVVVLAIVTWIVWLCLGVSGRLPASYLDVDVGGWVVWSLEFAISVFVVACPCGIGLAAPTALFVGSGLAAKYGIITRGGGEAFQEGAHMDIVVFDKTGTLTEGGDPQIVDHMVLNAELRTLALEAAHDLELNSSHPLGKSIRQFADNERETDGQETPLAVSNVKETAGRGLSGTLAGNNEAIIGNEAWMSDNGADLIKDKDILERIHTWKTMGYSIVMVGVKQQGGKFQTAMALAAADKIRPEAKEVVNELQNKLKIEAWMISGDNEVTAKAVASEVGIAEDHVIAGVLPNQKAERIKWLQTTGGGDHDMMRSWWEKLVRRDTKSRAVVGMVGDGINDAPSLSAADVGIAIGSGSDIAISTAKFVLVRSDLRAILTLVDVSRAVLNRVKLNFFWAGIYNVVSIPIAAGVIYPYKNSRLPPAWASLAMALSSVSVVSSSLALKLYKPKHR